jgi:hypothetical protein
MLEDKKLRVSFLYEKLKKQKEIRRRSRHVEKHIQLTEYEIGQLEKELQEANNG